MARLGTKHHGRPDVGADVRRLQRNVPVGRAPRQRGQNGVGSLPRNASRPSSTASTPQLRLSRPIHSALSHGASVPIG